MPIRLAAFLPAPRFNTQPPEGGWLSNGIFDILAEEGFNTQPPEGGWLHIVADPDRFAVVSTHSRLKAAGTAKDLLPIS